MDAALSEGQPALAACYLAELVARDPDDRHTRTALAIALGDAGYPAGALKILRSLADNLAHRGLLLPAVVTIRHGLEHAPDDAGLISTLKRLHVRGVHAKMGHAPPLPPPLKSRTAPPPDTSAAALRELDEQERCSRCCDIGCAFGPPGEAALPMPLPLFSELDEEAFVETVRQLHYKKLPKDTPLLTEGEAGDFLLIIASGHVNILKGGQRVARLGPTTVLGEMALITGAPRSASAIADEEVEVFELLRRDVQKIAQAKPKIAEELLAYCRKRLIDNLLRTSPLFKRLDAAAHAELLQRFKRVGFAQGQTLIEQGQQGKGLFVIAAGDVQVTTTQDGQTTVLANLGPGNVLGEISLLHAQPTTATVTASSAVGTLFITREDFDTVVSAYPDVQTFLQNLSADRIQALKQSEESELLDADDLIVL